MKRRFFTLMLALVLAIIPSSLSAEDRDQGPLTYEGFEAWRVAVFEALKTEPVLNNPEETFDPAFSDSYLIAYAQGAVDSLTPTLDDPKQLMGIEFTEGLMACPVGLSLGSSLDSVVAAFPCDNPQWVGDEQVATLYLREPEAQGGDITWGMLLRDYEEVAGIEQLLAHPLGEGIYRLMSVLYVIQGGYVSGIRVSGFDQVITSDELEAKLAFVKEVAARSTFEPLSLSPQGMQAEAFGLEDLAFSGIDFAKDLPENVIGVLGDPDVDTIGVPEDDTTSMRELSYPGLECTFMLDAAEEPVYMASVLITDRSIPGPRGIRVGDALTDVLLQFRLEEQPWEGDQVILYARGETLDTPPFGLLENHSGREATLRYSLLLPEGSAVMLHISIEDLKVAEILLYRYEAVEGQG